MHRYLVLSSFLLVSIVAAQEPPSYAFVRVDVVSMESDSVLRDQTVVVSGDRITAIGASGDCRVLHDPRRRSCAEDQSIVSVACY